jgi:hypothetical protein
MIIHVYEKKNLQKSVPAFVINNNNSQTNEEKINK